MSRWSRWKSVWDAEPDDEGDWEDGTADEEEGDDELEGEWELDPNDPTHPDYDLSEAAGYADWEPSPKPALLRRGAVLLITLLILAALLMPVLLRIMY